MRMRNRIYATAEKYVFCALNNQLGGSKSGVTTDERLITSSVICIHLPCALSPASLPPSPSSLPPSQPPALPLSSDRVNKDSCSKASAVGGSRYNQCSPSTNICTRPFHKIPVFPILLEGGNHRQ